MKLFSKYAGGMVLLLALVLLAGCASKGYVDQAIAEERQRSQTALNTVEDQVKENDAVLERLQALTRELETKTTQALNQAKGFEDYVVIWSAEIYYDFNTSELTEEAKAKIDEGGDKMVADRSTVMEIEGFTDPTGDKAYNKSLGQWRAAAAKYYLVDTYGVNLYRIFTVSHGEKKAQTMDEPQTSYAKQRKVVMKLWGELQ